MNQSNNYQYDRSMEGRSQSSGSNGNGGPSPSINNSENFLQHLLALDGAAIQQRQQPNQQQQNPYHQQQPQQLQQQQQQPFYFSAVPNQSAAFNAGHLPAGALMGFDHPELLTQAVSDSQIQSQQQQHMQQNLFTSYPNDPNPAGHQEFTGHLGASYDSVQNQSLQQQGNGSKHGAFMQYDAHGQPVFNANIRNESISDIGGVSVPPMVAGTPTALHVEAAATTAATAAAPSKKRKATKKDTCYTSNKSPRASKRKAVMEPEPLIPSMTSPKMSASATALINSAMEDAENNLKLKSPSHRTTNTEHSYDIQEFHDDDAKHSMTAQEKAQSNRDRNREHARCTRLRKKAYVNKLKELVDGLHAERSEDTRKRRLAVQQLAEIQEARRKVIHTFLGFHAKYESDETKWKTILEEDFWLKQPVTPYRSFRRCEIEKGSRILKGINAMIGDAASMSVMIETIGSRNLRWLQRKRDDFLSRDSSKHPKTGKVRMRSGSSATMPHNIIRQNSRLQHAVSSLSSSSGSTAGSGTDGGEQSPRDKLVDQQQKQDHRVEAAAISTAKKVSSSSSSNDTRKLARTSTSTSNDFHDYHAPSLPDPLLDSGGSSPESDSPHDGDSDHCVVTKHRCTDSSSGDDINRALDSSNRENGKANDQQSMSSKPSPNSASHVDANGAMKIDFSKLPPNIARSGGISHNVTAAVAAAAATNLPNGHAQLSRAPAVALPPFAGIGKKASINSSSTVAVSQSHSDGKQKSTRGSTSKPFPQLPTNGSDERKPSGRDPHFHSKHRGNIITIENDTASSQSSRQKYRGIQASYYINEDDMVMTDDVLMCPFTFRSLDAVWCGALAECVMPGMLRACFSTNNRLKSVEMIFDAMGFCQQLEHASGNEGMAQIIPNSLEMALIPNSDEARVITLAKEPFAIVSVNEAWTRVTGYTQLDVEGKSLTILHGERTDPEAGYRGGLPIHDFSSVAQGISACSVNVHYDVNGREFLNFMCSYPLTNPHNEVTHMLHICQELPARA